MGVMEGRDSQHIRTKFSDIYQPALLANWKIWPAAQVCQLMLHV
jgi:protein Mpv17